MPAPGDSPPREYLHGLRNSGPLKAALRVLGALIGLALFAWAIRLALSQNEKGLEALRNAEAGPVLGLLALSLASLVLNGLMFWIVLRPVKKLKPLAVILTNCVATFLTILPFKLGLVARIVIHHRRDGVRFGTLVAWVAAMGALGLAVLIPFVGATLWRGKLDALWWIASLGGAIAFSALGVVLGRLAGRFPILHSLSFGADAIVRHPSGVAGHTLFRLGDVAVLAGRFHAGAAIAGVTLPAQQAVLLATIYFLLSVITPAGVLGFREIGVTALGISQGLDKHEVAFISLIVTGAEVLIAGAMTLIAAVVLRLDRVLLGARPPGPAPD